MRISAKASGIGGKNKEEIEKEHVRSYLELSRSLSGKTCPRENGEGQEESGGTGKGIE